MTLGLLILVGLVVSSVTQSYWLERNFYVSFGHVYFMSKRPVDYDRIHSTTLYHLLSCIGRYSCFGS